MRIRLPVTATPWLERLLVRLGRDARVVETDDPALAGAACAAARILRRYVGSDPRAAGRAASTTP